MSSHPPVPCRYLLPARLGASFTRHLFLQPDIPDTFVCFLWIEYLSCRCSSKPQSPWALSPVKTLLHLVFELPLNKRNALGATR
jgi:hypothetical protein